MGVLKQVTVTNCAGCSKSIQKKKKNHRFCSKRCAGYPKRYRGPFVCQYCKVSYFTKRSKRQNGEGEKFCSRGCAFKFKVGVNHHHYRADNHKPKESALCPVCNQIVQQPEKSGYRRYCSKICERKFAYQRDYISKVRLVARKCKHCLRSFTPKYGNQRRVFCSQVCVRRDAKAGRPRTHFARAKLFGVKREYFNVLRIFDRDKWRCQLCGIKTPKSLRGKQLNNSPELDHIIPLSVGGGHVWDNCQCACRRCNIAKSNKPLGQTRLFLGIPQRNDKKDNYINHMGGARQISGRLQP